MRTPARFLFFVLALALSCTVTLAAPQANGTSQNGTAALTNQDVESMLKAGLSEAIVVAKIRSSKTDFDTSPQALEQLKKQHVPDGVILAMIHGSATSHQSPQLAPTAGAVKASSQEDGKPRVYVSNSQSWLISGGFGAHAGTAAGATRGGSSPQTVEVIKTFGQRCPQVIVTNNRDNAAYVVLFDRESFKGLIRKRDKIAVFRRNGDVLFSNSVRSVGNAVKSACKAIEKDTPEGSNQ